MATNSMLLNRDMKIRMKKRIIECMAENGYDFELLNNNQLVLRSGKEKFSIIDVKIIKSGIQFTWKYSRRDNKGVWMPPTVGSRIMGSSVEGLKIGCQELADFLNKNSRLRRDYKQVDNVEMLKMLEGIGREYLDIETLETRNSDELDFYDVSVWGVRKALEEAYRLGYKEAMSNKR